MEKVKWTLDRASFAKWKIPADFGKTTDSSVGKEALNETCEIEKVGYRNVDNEVSPELHSQAIKNSIEKNAEKSRARNPQEKSKMKNVDNLVNSLTNEEKKSMIQSIVLEKDANSLGEINRLKQWLAKSSNADYEALINYFHNVMGVNSLSKQKMENVKHTLRTIIARKDESEKFVESPHPKFSLKDSNPRTKVLRLNSPDTRRDRFEHTTWHHLPPYKDNGPVDYPDSAYMQPNRNAGSTFRIHPDWEN